MRKEEDDLPDGVKITLAFLGGVWVGWLRYGEEKVVVQNAKTSRRAIGSLVRQWRARLREVGMVADGGYHRSVHESRR